MLRSPKQSPKMDPSCNKSAGWALEWKWSRRKLLKRPNRQNYLKCLWTKNYTLDIIDDGMESELGNGWSGDISIVQTQDDLNKVLSGVWWLLGNAKCKPAYLQQSKKTWKYPKVNSMWFLVFSIMKLVCESIKSPKLVQELLTKLLMEGWTPTNSYSIAGIDISKVAKWAQHFMRLSEFNKSSKTDVTTVEVGCKGHQHKNTARREGRSKFFECKRIIRKHLVPQKFALQARRF